MSMSFVAAFNDRKIESELEANDKKIVGKRIFKKTGAEYHSSGGEFMTHRMGRVVMIQKQINNI
jgi:hypothetical protein